MKGKTVLAACLGLGVALSVAPGMARASEGPEEVVMRLEPAVSARKGMKVQRGPASYYADRFHGRKMANGERFDRDSNSAASRTLPLGTTVQVTNLENGRTATVKIEDRGPYVGNRVIDLSPATAETLGMINAGVVMVEVRPVRMASLQNF
ncbi:RlpA-like protein precursor [Roseomonas gilardii subsp. rosea]|nr:RlpA-like protein precursor [Roseomonas gilardii subsp. rosea]